MNLSMFDYCVIMETLKDYRIKKDLELLNGLSDRHTVQRQQLATYRIEEKINLEMRFNHVES